MNEKSFKKVQLSSEGEVKKIVKLSEQPEVKPYKLNPEDETKNIKPVLKR